MTLKQLWDSKGYEYYPTDKFTHHRYQDIYEELFCKWKNEPINILEVGCYKNGSLKLFEDYFTQAHIVGLDNAEYEGAVKLNRAEVFIEDFYSNNRQLSNITIAIDDGPHDINSQLVFIEKVWPNIVSGGILIVEDVWPGFKPHFDALNIPYTIIEFCPPTDEDNDRIIIMRK